MRRGRAWTIAPIVWLALLAAASPAYAVRAVETPTPRQLWNAYPLDVRKGAPTPAATPAIVSPGARAGGAPTPRGSASRLRGTAPSSGGPPLLVLALLVAALAFAGGLFAALRRRRAAAPVVAAALTEPERASMAPPPDVPERRFAPRVYPPPARPAPPPPATPARADHGTQGGGVAVLRRAAEESVWRAEIVWRDPEFISMLVAPGAHGQSEGSELPESARRAAAVAALERELEADGWTPVAPGARWYSRRFVWPYPQPPSGAGGST